MLELRLLNDEDISLVEVWLNKEHVKKWYEIPHLGVSINDWLYELKAQWGIQMVDPPHCTVGGSPVWTMPIL